MTTLSNPLMVLFAFVALAGNGVVLHAQPLPLQTRGELLYNTHCLQKSMPSSSSFFVRLEGACHHTTDVLRATVCLVSDRLVTCARHEG